MFSLSSSLSGSKEENYINKNMKCFISQATRLLINSLHIYVRLIAVIILFSEMTEKLDHKSAHKA
jgi:hypothetical protein